MSLRLAKPEHEIAYQDLVRLLRKNADKLTSLEMLAIAANMVGKLIAMQDQRSVTPSIAMEIVTQNIEHGNKEVFEQLSQSAGHA